MLEVIQSMLHRYQEAGGSYSVIDLKNRGGIGVFFPGVQVIDGAFCEVTESKTSSQNALNPE